MRAIVYLRISKDRTGLEAGVTRQREDCEQRARERGWQIVGIHQDNDLEASSGKRHRPGFEAVLSAIHERRAEVVVAWSLDRLQRNKRDELRLFEICKARGTVLSFVNGPDLDLSTATGRLVADQLGAMARFEVELKSDRQKRSTQQAAAQGRRTGGRRPFGFDADGVTVREDEAQAIRDGYKAILSGVPVAEVARDWNRRGFTTGQIGHRTGEPGRWRRDNVRAVLLNPRNIGQRAYLGEIVATAEWPALVDEDTYRAVKAAFEHRAGQQAPSSARSLLSGLALCGVCGATGATVHSGGGGHAYRIYRCSGSTGHVSRQAEPVDNYVATVMCARLARPDAVELLVDTAKPDVNALREKATALRSRLDTLAVDFADGALTGSQIRTATERVRANLAEVEAEMADAGRVDVLGPLIRATDVRVVWDDLGTARQRVVIDTLAVVRLLPPGRGVRAFSPETVQVAWRTQ